jgi:hypothetical protein
MKTQSAATLAGVLLATLALGVPAAARDHSALNGTWVLVPQKCEFRGQAAVQSGTVTIDDRQGNISVLRHFVYDGAGETYFYSDLTDSERNATIHSGKDIKSKMRWDHDVLKVTTTQAGAVTVESYTLEPDGSLRVMVVRPEGKAVTLVCQRQ